MVKQMHLLPRRAGLAVQAFHDYWRHPHGTMGRQVTSVVRYVQSHRLDTPHLGPAQARFDGVVESWYASVDAARAVAQEPTYAGYLAASAARFVDQRGIRGVLACEEAVAERPATSDAADLAWDHERAATAIKLFQFVERERADRGAPPAVDLLGPFRHVRSRPAPIPGKAASAAPFVRVEELWWPTLSAFEAGVAAAPQAWDAFLADPGQAVVLLTQAERFL